MSQTELTEEQMRQAMAELGANQEPEEAPPKTFDEMAVDSLTNVAQVFLQQYPEVRAIFIGLDYEKDLNDTDVNQFVWMGRNGPVGRADELVGCIRQSLKLTMNMIDRGFAFDNHLRQSFSEQLKKHEALQHEIEAARQELEEIRSAGRAENP